MNYTLFVQAFLSKYRGIKDNQLLFQYLREELQYLILQTIFTKMTYPVYFMGGTNLRLSYGINRFSEDIDLALDKPDPDFPSEQFFADITKSFSKKVTGFDLQNSQSVNNNIVKLTLAFPRILFDLKLSPLSPQTVKIKLELDKNPPKSAAYEKRTYRSMAGDYMISTHDLPTGFAGKIHALLFREYQKGRDYYDLQWYLERNPKIDVNLKYLNAAASQQNKNSETFKNKKEVFEAIAEKVKNLDLSLMRHDLERFIIMDQRSFQEWLKAYITHTLTLLQNES